MPYCVFISPVRSFVYFLLLNGPVSGNVFFSALFGFSVLENGELSRGTSSFRVNFMGGREIQKMLCL